MQTKPAALAKFEKAVVPVAATLSVLAPLPTSTYPPECAITTTHLLQKLINKIYQLELVEMSKLLPEA